MEDTKVNELRYVHSGNASCIRMGDEIACVELAKWLYDDVLAAELEGLARQLKLQALVSEKAVVTYST